MTSPLMLFESVPLVTTDKLGAFFESVPVGHFYGDLSRSRVKCIKIEQSLYLVGAHPWQEITECFVSKKRTDGFDAFSRVDSDGVTRQYISLSTPPAEDDPTIEVSGKGKVSPISGKLLENPDEIIEDLARLCGREINFPLFREDCNRRGVRIGGHVTEIRSLRSYINEIIESVGAKWLGSNAVFFPNDSLGYARPVDTSIGLEHAIEMDDVAGVIVVYYAWNHSEQRHGAYIELTAKGCQYTNKGIIYAKWLRLAKDAEALGRRILGKRAGEFVKTSGTVPGIVRAGEVVQIETDTFSGLMLVQGAEPREVETLIKGEIVLSAYPYIEVTQFSTENRSTRSERIDVLLDVETKEAKITVFDSQNRPIEGVLVTYDGAVSKKTDKLGIVTITVSTGNHTLVLEGENIDNNDPYPLFIP